MRWLRHHRTTEDIPHDIYIELVRFFRLSEREQCRPAKISEGRRMTTETRALWVHFREERKGRREVEEVWLVKDWWGDGEGLEMMDEEEEGRDEVGVSLG